MRRHVALALGTPAAAAQPAPEAVASIGRPSALPVRSTTDVDQFAPLEDER